eukprot:365377-Chlamydomonas_euryale.AAC.43
MGSPTALVLDACAAWLSRYAAESHRHARRHCTGEVSDEAKKLCETTRQALNDAIKVCKPGVPYKAIGSKIHNLADKHKFGVVRDYVGHGVGKAFHSAPTITHFRNNGSGVMQPWQTFTIEPMLVEVSGRGPCTNGIAHWVLHSQARSAEACPKPRVHPKHADIAVAKTANAATRHVTTQCISVCHLSTLHIPPPHLLHPVWRAQGSIKCKTWKDKWTVVTEDGGLCAQWEHTLLITPDGCEILTAYDGMGIETPVKGTGGSKGTGF